MPPWFEQFDQAASGVGENIAAAGQFIGGGVNDVVTGTTETAGEAIGSFTGGAGPPLTKWGLIAAAAIVAAVVLPKVL